MLTFILLRGTGKSRKISITSKTYSFYYTYLRISFIAPHQKQNVHKYLKNFKNIL